MTTCASRRSSLLRVVVVVALFVSAAEARANANTEPARATGHTCAHDAYRASTRAAAARAAAESAESLRAAGHVHHGRHGLPVTAPSASSGGAGGGRSALGAGAGSGGGVRIVPIFVNVSGDAAMTPAKVAFLTAALVPNATARWATMLALRVPVSGNLFAYRDCTGYWTASGAYPCASLATTTYCASSPGDQVIAFNSTFLGAQTYYSASGTPTTLPGGPGLPNADFGLFVTAKQTALCASGSSGTLAYAQSCQRDAFDRPSWGRINLCPAALDPSPGAWAQQLYVAIHEVGHALGFTSDSWPLFRYGDAGRTPKSTRDPHYPFTTLASYSLTCAGTPLVFNLASTATTVAYFAERGMSQCSAAARTLTPTTNCVARAVGAAVTAAARDYFACATLPGAELENQLTTACDFQGSHWEQRVLNSELMASYVSNSMAVSALTLAQLEDSGWYTALYAGADNMTAGATWGFRQGCAFAQTGVCVTSAGGAGSPPHFSFVTRSLAQGTGMCTPERLAVGYVDVVAYSSALPNQYRYFADPSTGGAASPATMEYCPAVTGYSNRRCTVPTDAPSSVALFGEAYGATSRCFASTLCTTAAAGQGYVGNGAGCYTYSCAGFGTPSASLSVTVVASPSSQTVTCGPGSAGAARAVAGFSGSFTCPDPLALCSRSIGYSAPFINSSAAGGGGGGGGSGSGSGASDSGGAQQQAPPLALIIGVASAVGGLILCCGVVRVCCRGGDAANAPAPKRMPPPAPAPVYAGPPGGAAPPFSGDAAAVPQPFAPAASAPTYGQGQQYPYPAEGGYPTAFYPAPVPYAPAQPQYGAPPVSVYAPSPVGAYYSGAAQAYAGSGGYEGDYAVGGEQEGGVEQGRRASRVYAVGGEQEGGAKQGRRASRV